MKPPVPRGKLGLVALAGRADESAAVLAHLGEAAAGHASTLLVRGEPGVGKTSLVGEACQDARVETIWASCLPLTSMTTPLLPLRGALRRAGLGDDVTLVAFDSWLDRATADRPLALVVDDLQWADQSTLDVLLYVIAGRADRGLAVTATIRAGAEGDRLSGWLADVQRLPRARELVLDRLDRAGTGEQIAGLLGRPADEGLVDEVFARTAGNPYLTSLLVRDLDPHATALPAARPARLRDAVIRPWREMSAPARELTRILAVGGHPQHYEGLARITPALGFDEPVLPGLREAVEVGVLRADGDERYWFTHPLLAEILDGDLLPEQRRQMHARYAAALGDGDPTQLADHYDRAGMAEPAFRWAVRAAEVTAGAPERLRLLRRALALWPVVGEPRASRIDLWERAQAASREAGFGPDELEAVEALIGLVSPDREPLWHARLVHRRRAMREGLGLDGPDVAAWRAVVALTAPYPDSVEHARSMIELADQLLSMEDPEGVALAATAFELAEASGDDETLAEALVVRVYAGTSTRRPGAEEDAERAWRIAASLRHFGLIRLAAYASANARAVSRREIAGIYHRAAEDLVALGAPHSHVAEMCAWEARCLLLTGDGAACRQRLRVALGARPGARGDVVARLTAATLAALQGRTAEAEGHLARAEEIFGADRGGVQNVYFDEIRALVALEAGDPDRAFAIALHGLECMPYVEEMLPIATRALADQAEAAEDPVPILARLTDFRRRYPSVVADLNATSAEATLRAFQLRADAETARANRDPAELPLWRAAADACHEAEVPWDEAYGRWRLAQATLRDRSTHREAPEALRRAYKLAVDLGARRLITELEQLARSARVDLTPAERPVVPPPELPGLTRREREVLAHLMTGRTNAEIAKALVLSEKTIGVHISNMLRKTGTTNRVQLAELARRSRGRKSEEENGDF
ncbi:LuxR C-terminal-related transcriptional regulator [Actinoplanes sp. CA-142083]|uniref:helix-turn-helix transcriptional regulator n=1 Tax=Actinoplanes sp. CA-142083 TaxID=3239903 RepID=UPI003D8CEE01